MAIYKQALTKYIKSISLWIVLGVSILISVLIGVWAPNHFVHLDMDAPMFENTTEISRYIILSVLAVSTTTSALCIFMAVFAGFSGAKLFKDEVEDGTFLTLLSKPTTRTKIVMYKWLALLTIMIIFTFMVSFSWTLATLGLDYGKQLHLSIVGAEALSKKAWVIGAIMWGVLLLLTTLFSSIAILISTKLSTSATVGIVITIGVIIPTTGFITTTFIKSRYESTKSSWFVNNASIIKQLQDRATPVIDKQIREILNSASKNNTWLSNIKKQMPNFSVSSIYKNFNKELVETKNALEGSDNILSFATDTQEHDGYRAASFFDLNYQVQLFSNFASDRAIPDIAKNLFTENISMINKPFLGYASLIDSSRLNVSKDEEERIQIFDSAYARGVRHLRKLGLDMLKTTKWIVAAAMVFVKDNNNNPFEYRIINNKMFSTHSGTISLDKNFDWNKVFRATSGFNDKDSWKVTAHQYLNAMNLYRDLYNGLEYKDGLWINEKTKDRLVDKQGAPIKLTADKIFILGTILNSFNKEIINELVKNIPKSKVNLPSELMQSFDHIDMLSDFIDKSLNDPYKALINIDKTPWPKGTYTYKDVVYAVDGDPTTAVPLSYRTYRSSFDTLEYLAGKGELKSVEQKPYLNKHILLYTYIALALLLVPASILLILKKEFR